LAEAKNKCDPKMHDKAMEVLLRGPTWSEEDIARVTSAPKPGDDLD